jgi:hypothetical protein
LLMSDQLRTRLEQPLNGPLTGCCRTRLARPRDATLSEALMILRTFAAVSVVLAPCLLNAERAMAQDVPGIEICTVEKTMERRTSCLQSNVYFLQKTIAKLASDNQQKLDAANRQIEGLKSTVAGLQKTMDDLQAAQKKDAAPPKDAAPVKDASPVKEVAPAKEGAK